MILRLFSVLLPVACALFATTPAAAQQCNAQDAVPVSFASATRAPDAPACVSMDGVLVGLVLAEDDVARYRRETEENTPSSTGAVLGIDLSGVAALPQIDGPLRVRVIGQLSDCADVLRRAAARSDGPVRLGYCQHVNGRVIEAVAVEVLGPATITRLLPGTADGDFGNLAPMAAGDVRQQMRNAAGRLLDAIRAGDRDRVVAMHGAGPGGRRAPGVAAELLRLVFDDPQSPFAAIRADAPVAIEIFGWKPPLWADSAWHAARARTGTAEGIACFSSRPDAPRLWPIDSRDADNLTGRPYACSRIIIAGTGADAPATFDTERARNGAAEP